MGLAGVSRRPSEQRETDMVGTWQFEVDGPLKGFIVNARPWSMVAKDYCAFKSRVRLLANVAGVPDEIPAGYRAAIHLDVSWKMLAKIDLDNLQKAATDSIFKKDRRVGEIHAIRRLNTGQEKMVITVRLGAESA